MSADGGGDEGATVVAASPEAGPPIMPAPAAPVSAPAPDERGDGGRLSPLNPAADEFSDAGAVSAPADYDHLLADIAALRARIAAVSDTLFHSRIAIGLRVSGDHARIASLSVSIDDGQVWSSPASFRAEAETTVYDHAVAPGHHAVTVDVERRDDRNDTFRSAQRSRFIVDVPSDRRLSVQLDLSDDSNVARDFPADGDGRYDLRIRAHVRADSVPR
ncbi:MAG TPA: hypothetical protein VEK07_20075 [Polyangiaceae bacterium]|nr:hypothetical protein [Polyangiaceae bacterium]